MHRLYVTRKSILAALLGAALLCLLALYSPRHILFNEDHRLELEGYGYNLGGQPFTGVALSTFGRWQPSHLRFFYKGQFFASEYIWYPNGQLMVDRPHKDGLPDGKWKMWYEDGSVKSLRTYSKGQLQGEMWGWHANGQISDFNLYDNGQEISHKSWVTDGTPYYNYVYYQGKKVGMKGGEFCKPLQKLYR